MTNKKVLLKTFQMLPGVGISIAQDLIDMGYTSLFQIAKQDPEKMYEQLNTLRGTKIDRCMLYTFRCVQYFLNTQPEKRKPELLKWWNWRNVKIHTSGEISPRKIYIFLQKK